MIQGIFNTPYYRNMPVILGKLRQCPQLRRTGLHGCSLYLYWLLSRNILQVTVATIYYQITGCLDYGNLFLRSLGPPWGDRITLTIKPNFDWSDRWSGCGALVSGRPLQFQRLQVPKHGASMVSAVRTLSMVLGVYTVGTQRVQVSVGSQSPYTHSGFGGKRY